MSKRDEERGRFIERMREEGVPEHVARLVIRHTATLHRLAEAACNGDWPCDNGERKVKFCTRCEGGMVPSKMDRNGVCEDCRIGDRVKALLAPYNIEPILNGDPRGAVVKLKVPSGRTDDWGREGLCVPCATS